MPLNRLVGNYFLTQLTSYSAGVRSLRDVPCGLFGIHRTMFESFDLIRGRCVRFDYRFELDLITFVGAVASQIKQFEISTIYGFEETSLKIRKYWLTAP